MLGTDLPSATALAFLGDAVHSHMVRAYLVKQGISSSKNLNEAALAYVTAQSQAQAFHRIESRLTEEETAVYRRAFNSKHLNRPKNVSGIDYRTATGFEALLGMLDITGDHARIHALLSDAYGVEM